MINTPARRLAICIPVFAPLMLLTPSPVQEVADLGWPREITVPAGTVVIYQPQPEALEGNALTSRAAVSVTRAGSATPEFGVVWTTARVDTDLDSRTVRLLDINVDRVRFSDATAEQQNAFGTLLEEEIPQWDLEISLDRLLTSLEFAERARRSDENLLSTAPVIVFTTEPTVLVSIDGEPRMVPVEGSDVARVVNTPFTILRDGDGPFYLYADSTTWYTAPTLDGDWRATSNVPRTVADLAPPPPEPAETDPEAATLPDVGPRPNIVVATEPTELIVTDGVPEYAPIDGTDLLYVSNTESDVLLEISAQRHYLVLSGRWFSSDSLAGAWVHVPPDELPSSFAEIPAASEMGHLLVSVPGTEAATEAVIESQIPQTAAILRSEASLEVTYDGEPQFEEIDGTDMAYAVNTEYSVLEIDGRFYACHEAVWFTADAAQGPWRLAESVPEDVYSMPPSSPIYNVKYVYIYDTTPNVVYVGYYPGYMYSYVYGGTIVYGTGYYYRPWYGSVYYPHHATWGFHVRYNPWYGWAVGFSYSTGPFTFAIGRVGYGGGWWGPAGYRGYHPGYHRGWHAGYRAGAGAGYRAGLRVGGRQNIYRRPGNAGRVADRPSTDAGRRPSVAAGRQNDVFADRNGNVSRGTDQSRQARQRGTGRAGTFQRSGGGRTGGGRR